MRGREGGDDGERKSCTSAVPEVVVGGGVVLAEPLQDEFVVQQAVERPEEEDVEGQVANSLLLKVSAQSLRLPAGPEGHQVKMKHSSFKWRFGNLMLAFSGSLHSPTYRPAPARPGTLNVSADELSTAADAKKELKINNNPSPACVSFHKEGVYSF